MPTMRRRLTPVTLAAAVCVGTAAWSSAGLLTLTDGGAGASRVGLLPPWWMWAACVAGAVALAAALRLTRDRAMPLFATGALVLPWLPLPLPAAVLVLAGPVGVVVWIAALVAAVTGETRARGRVGDPGRVPARWYAQSRRAPWVACVLAAVVYLGVGWRLSSVVPGGDEPHYLIITQSLLQDGDLRIENNHRQGDYLSYFAGVLRPDYLRRGLDREIYSIHLPGVSALVAPAFALGGHAAVKVWLALLAALAAGAVWRTAYVATGQAGAAWFAWAGVALTAPFLFLSFTVYPDGPGGVVVAAVLVVLVTLHREASRPWWTWALAGTAAASLPWLHPRFSVVAAALGVVFVLRAWSRADRWRALAAFASAPVVSALAWFGYYQVIYGSPNPSVAYGHYTQMSLANVGRGLTGLLVDQQFGLVAAAPVYAAVCAGVVVMARRHRRLAAEWLVIVVPYAIVSAMYHMWWGGHSSPARFLGPVMLACALPAAFAWSSAVRRPTRLLLLTLLGASLALAAALASVEGGRLVFNVRDGQALWAVWATRSADVVRALPSVFRTTPGTAAASAAGWVAALAGAWLLCRTAADRLRLSGGREGLLFAVCMAVAICSAAALSWRLEGATGLSPAGGQLALFSRAAQEPGAVVIRYDPVRVVSAAEGLAAVRLDGAGAAGRPADAWLWAPRLPAGRYRVWSDMRAGGAAVEVVIGRGDAAIDRWRLPSGRTSREIVLPWPVRSLTLRGDDAQRRQVRRLELEAVSVKLPAGYEGAADGRVTAARRYGDVVVMGVGESVYLEPSGLWVAGLAASRLLLAAPDSQATVPLRVRAGAVPTTVTLAAGAWQEQWELAAGETRAVSVPLAGGSATVLTVTVSTGFTPARLDPNSSDTRLLGVWVGMD